VPLYEFKCDRCGKRFEVLCSAGTKEEVCPSCGAEGAGRVLSTFVARGSGGESGGGSCGTCSSSSCSTCGT